MEHSRQARVTDMPRPWLSGTCGNGVTGRHPFSARRDLTSAAKPLRYSSARLIRRLLARGRSAPPAVRFRRPALIRQAILRFLESMDRWQCRVPVATAFPSAFARFPRAHAPRFPFPVRSDHVVDVAPRFRAGCGGFAARGARIVCQQFILARGAGSCFRPADRTHDADARRLARRQRGGKGAGAGQGRCHAR